MALTSRHALLVTALLVGCAPRHVSTRQEGPPADRSGPSFAQSVLILQTPCARQQAEVLATATSGDQWPVLRAARCYVDLAQSGTDESLRRADAARGRELADLAVERYPESALAHYLAAVLTGLVAKNDPVRGLSLVPVIEREATRAAALDPRIDRGGPDRVLGELYLRAPGFPVSVGDPERAVAHFRKAVRVDSEMPESRLGLIEALLANEDASAACVELAQLLGGFAPAKEDQETWTRALDLLERMCRLEGE